MFEAGRPGCSRVSEAYVPGKYLLVFEIVDLEARDRYFPAEHQGADEIGRFDEQNRQAAGAWERLNALRAESDITTDYVVVAE
jgi:hypothetical protein